MIGDVDGFIAGNRPFVQYLKEWEESLPSIALEEVIEKAGGPERVAVITVDMIEGFCRSGPLSSPRVEALIAPVVRLLEKAHGLGVSHLALTQDAHEETSREFGAFPAHCVAGTPEADTVREIRELPFFGRMKVFPKRSISSHLATGLEEWLTGADPRAVVVLGDCTDLCTYQLTMFARLLANARGHGWEVILPIDCVDTYDLPVETAAKIGAMPHPADFFNAAFTYHMALNGIRVARELR
jgi:nicotinamidase-related amidase